MNLWRGEDEDRRNINSAELFIAMIREAYGDIEWVGCEHHTMFKRLGGSQIGSIPSADSLIFDHSIAKRIWGERYLDYLIQLAVRPAETRDVLIRKMYETREVKS